MLDILVASVLIAAKPPVEPNWVKLGESATTRFYLDMNSIRGKGAYRIIDYYNQSLIGEENLQASIYIECNTGKTITTKNPDKIDRKKLSYAFESTFGREVLNKICPMIKK